MPLHPLGNESCFNAGGVGSLMCEDCEQAMEAVIANKPKCPCSKCRTGGSVLAVEGPPGSVPGLHPWCVSCHHFIVVTHP